MKREWTAVGAMVFVAAVQAQSTVYKCNARSYSEQPCSSRVVRTYDAPMERPTLRASQAASVRLPGESAEHFSLRRRRGHLNASDRDECARLDKRIPFEQERVRQGAHQQEADEANDSLAEARKRFAHLMC